MKIAWYLSLLTVLSLAMPLAIGGRSVFMILTWLATLLTLIFFRSHRYKVQLHGGVVLAVVVLILAGTFGAIVYRRFEPYYLLKMVQNFCLMFVVLQWSRGMSAIQRIIAAFVVGGTVSILSGLIDLPTTAFERAAGLVQNPNGYGQVCAQVLILCVGLLSLTASKARKAALVGVIIASFFGLMYSGSRGAFFALIGGGLILMVLQSHRGKMFALATLGVVLFLNYAPPVFLDRLDRAFVVKKQNRESGIEERLYLARIGFAIYADHPVFGVGTGNVSQEMKRRMGATKVTHNVFTQLLAETGTFGALAFLYILIKCFNILRVQYRNLNVARADKVVLGTLTAFMSTLVIGQTSSGNFIHPQWYFITGLILGLHYTLGPQNQHGRVPAKPRTSHPVTPAYPGVVR